MDTHFQIPFSSDGLGPVHSQPSHPPLTLPFVSTTRGQREADITPGGVIIHLHFRVLLGFVTFYERLNVIITFAITLRVQIIQS